jgi:uncharacterized damage-inducible protein DinB
VTGCIGACHQCITIAQMLTAEQYTSGREEHRSIGEHLRHCLEHFQCFFVGIDTACIDYDTRNRNPEIERFAARFVEAMDDVVCRLKTLDHASLTMPLHIRTLCGSNGERAEVSTTLGRELAFLCTHVIHHVAIMKELAHSMGITLPEGFGVAYSTSIHRASASVAAFGETILSSCAP